MKDLIWTLAFFGVLMSAIGLDSYIESKEFWQTAMWQAHRAYMQQHACEFAEKRAEVWDDAR